MPFHLSVKFFYRFFLKKESVIISQSKKLLPGTRVHLLGDVKNILYELATDPKWKDSKVRWWFLDIKFSTNYHSSFDSESTL